MPRCSLECLGPSGPIASLCLHVFEKCLQFDEISPVLLPTDVVGGRSKALTDGGRSKAPVLLPTDVVKQQPLCLCAEVFDPIACPIC